MASPINSGKADRRESGELKISAAMANHRPTSTRSGSTGRIPTDGETTGVGNANTGNNTTSASDEESTKLPPSPLVTPPMGSNPSQTAEEAISPRNLLPADAIIAAVASNTEPQQQSPGTEGYGSPSSSNQSQQQQQQQQHPRGIPHVYHDYAKLSGPGPAFIRKKTGGVTQRKYYIS